METHGGHSEPHPSEPGLRCVLQIKEKAARRISYDKFCDGLDLIAAKKVSSAAAHPQRLAAMPAPSTSIACDSALQARPQPLWHARTYSRSCGPDVHDLQGVDPEEIKKLVQSSQPKTNATTPEAVKFHDDKVHCVLTLCSPG